jgi:hypothetical protein
MFPWLRLLDVLIGVTDIARRTTRPGADELVRLTPGRRALGLLEARFAGVVVAALKEAFDRDSRRLELEREQMEAERQRAERALHLELLRQAGDREIGRLRLVAGVAVASWIATLFLSTRLIGANLGAQIALGGGWALLVAALASAFVAQSRVADALSRMDEANDRREALRSGAAGRLSPWLIVIGLALVSVAVMFA